MIDGKLMLGSAKLRSFGFFLSGLDFVSYIYLDRLLKVLWFYGREFERGDKANKTKV